MRLLTPTEVAEMLGIPDRTLDQWRYLRRGPAFVKIGRHARYHPEDVAAWIAAQRRGGEGVARNGAPAA
jgi:excisionase family DNA binding protein